MDNYEFARKLEARLLIFTKNVSDLCFSSSKNFRNSNIIDQLLRSSSSVGANYIEANEAISKKDFFHRIKICRKESKESIYWLELLAHTNSDRKEKTDVLIKEASEYLRLFSAIINKS